MINQLSNEPVLSKPFWLWFQHIFCRPCLPKFILEFLNNTYIYVVVFTWSRTVIVSTFISIEIFLKLGPFKSLNSLLLDCLEISPINKWCLWWFYIQFLSWSKEGREHLFNLVLKFVKELDWDRLSKKILFLTGFSAS